MKRFLIVSVTGAVALTIGSWSSDGAAKVARAQYCLSIDVAGEAADELALRFDVFARDADLEIDDSNPPLRIYYPPVAGDQYPADSSAMIALEQMGPWGSILSYIVLKEGAPSDLLDRLKRFVLEEISGSYRTVKCEEIKGFSAPEVYN